MKKKLKNFYKAFTLIELLSIVILLAVISLIATPIVLNIIKEAQESADMSSANLIVSAGKDFYSEAILDSKKMDKIKNYQDLYADLVIMNKPSFGQLYLNTEGKVAMVTIINNKCYKKTYETNIEKVELNDCDLGYMAPDDIKPTVSQEVVNTKANENDWYNQNLFIKVNVIDNESGPVGYKRCMSQLECEPSDTIYDLDKNIYIDTESQTNYVCVIGVDEKGNESEKDCQIYRLDKTQPIINGINDLSIIINDKLDLANNVTVDDALSGIDGVLEIDPPTIDTSIIGTTQVKYKVKDMAGNIKEITRNIIIDAYAPTVEFNLVDNSSINENGWANKDFYIRAIITDNSETGIKIANSCTVNSSSECTPIASFTGTTKDFLITTEGSNRACVEVTDNNNKTTKVCSDTYNLDKTAPIAGTATFTGTLGSNNWYTTNVTVNVENGSDSLSGHSSTTSNIYNITSNTVGQTVTITTTDKAGNTANRSYVIKVDKGTPEVPTVTMRYAEDNKIYSSNTWSNQNINVYLSSDAPTSSIAYYEYSTNRTSWTRLSGNTLRVSNEGTTNLYFRSVSNSGAKSNSTNLNVVKIDKTAPSTPSIVMKKGSTRGTTYTQDTWSNQDIYITLNYTRTDASGIDHYEYSNNGRTWYKFTNSSSITTEGTTELYFRAVDGAGNNGNSTSVYKIKIDKTSPSTPSIAMKKSNSRGETYESDSWVNDQVYIALSYSRTDTSGIDYYEYSTNKSTWYTVSGNSMNHTTEGTTNLYFRAVDNAGNKGTATSVYKIKIDETKPATPTIKMTKGSKNGLTYVSNTWSNKDVYVTLSVSKTDSSGIDHYEYSTNNYTWNKMTIPYLFDDDGTEEVYFRAVDGAGNASSSTSKQIIKIDTVAPFAPTITIRKGSDSGSIYSSGTWQPLDLYIKGSYSRTDTSGIAGYQMSTDNRNWTVTSTSSSRINMPGQYTVYLRAVDNAGNIGTVAKVYNVYKSEYLVDSGAGNGHFVYYKNLYWRIVGRSGSGKTGTVTLISDGCVGPTYKLSPGNSSMIGIINKGINNYAKSLYDRNYIYSYHPINTSEIYKYSRNNTVGCSYWAYNGTSPTANYVASNSTSYTAYNAAAVTGGALKRELSGRTRIILTTKAGVYVTNNKNGAGTTQAWTIGY